jgi:uroporphyrin-III C-methyltransferase/precorrin-2 dehydrogenase/sirohydrochlorin ferrochelatase
MTDTFMLALPVTDRSVRIFGGCAQSAMRAEQWLVEGARVTVIWPVIGDEVRQLCARYDGRAQWIERTVDATQDLADVFAAVLVPVDSPLAAPLFAVASAQHRLFCAVDQPEFCTFYHVATVRRGPMRFGISSGGVAPGLAKRFREALEESLTPEFTAFAERWAAARQRAAKGQRVEATASFLRELFLQIRVTIAPSTERN